MNSDNTVHVKRVKREDAEGQTEVRNKQTHMLVVNKKRQTAKKTR